MTTMYKRARWGRVLILNSLLPVLAVLLSFGFTLRSAAQAVQTVSYQGLLEAGSVPMNGNVDLDVTYYYAASGTVLLTESFRAVPVTNGVFGIELGSQMGGIPSSIDLTQAIELGISVNGSAELIPRVRMTAVPYALSSHSIDGIQASPTPVNGKIFPVPLDANGLISPSLLPAPLTLNGLPAVNGNLEIAGGSNVSVERNTSTGQLIISSAGNRITGIALGQGLIGGGNTGVVSIALDPGNIQGSWIAPGTINGYQMTAGFAGDALYFNELGNLNLAFDPAHFVVASNTLLLRTDVPVTGTVATFNSLNVSGSSALGTGDGSWTTIVSPVSMLQGADLGQQRITMLGIPVDPLDAVTKQYVDDQINPVAAALLTKVDAQLSAGNVFIGNESNLAQGMTLAGDATVSSDGYVTVSHAALADNFSLALQGDVKGRQSTTFIKALQGIPVNASEPADGQFLGYSQAANSWQPMNVVLPVAGKIALRNNDGLTMTLSSTVTNSSVTTNSIIMLTVVQDNNSTITDHYIVFVSNLTNGSFTINMEKALSVLFTSGEGATIHYVIFN